jgi:hypothetical protein
MKCSLLRGVNAVIILLICELNTAGSDINRKSKFEAQNVKQFRVETKLRKLKFLEHYVTYFAKFSIYIRMLSCELPLSRLLFLSFRYVWNGRGLT